MLNFFDDKFILNSKRHNIRWRTVNPYGIGTSLLNQIFFWHLKRHVRMSGMVAQRRTMSVYMWNDNDRQELCLKRPMMIQLDRVQNAHIRTRHQVADVHDTIENASFPRSLFTRRETIKRAGEEAALGK